MSETMYRAFTPDLEVQKSGDGRTVRGIAVPYGRPQPIDDHLTEEFCRGAFDHQMAAIHRVGFYRDHANQGGTLLGRQTTARDDAAGLYGEWRVSKTAVGDETLELVKDGALSQLSIGFHPLPGGSRLVNGVTRRTKANLFEVAIVPRGAYGDGATVTGVRSAACSTCRRRIRPNLREAARIFADMQRI
jgi:HK97 family phage prohead protease